MPQLRIALIAPPWFSVPPPGYGGTERVVAYLADGLVARGHDVTLFASGGSRTSARLVSTFAEPPSSQLGDPFIEASHLAEAYGARRQFDIIHDHSLLGLLPAALVEQPVVHTVHGVVDERTRLIYEAAARLRRIHFVAISEDQRTTLPAGLDSTVIHNALDTRAFPFSSRAGEYLLFVGRATPDKGPLEAIEIARRAGLPLKMLLKVNEPPEHEYFRSVLEPAARRGAVEILQQPPEAVKLSAYRDALATLFPISWREPFGLVMIESMATGTPVVAFRCGSVPEVIDHGVTGFTCTTVEEAVEAVKLVPGLDRRACRDRVESRFSVALNVLRHEELYRRVLAGRPAANAGRPEDGSDADGRGLSTAAPV